MSIITLLLMALHLNLSGGFHLYPRPQISLAPPTVSSSPVHKTVSVPVNSHVVAEKTALPQRLVQSNILIPPVISTSQSTKDPTPPNPLRPYYDIWGNEFDYTGNLLHATCPSDSNPLCVCPAPQYVQAYDKDTNRAVCNDKTNACQYADATSANSTLCQKVTQEHQ